MDREGNNWGCPNWNTETNRSIHCGTFPILKTVSVNWRMDVRYQGLCTRKFSLPHEVAKSIFSQYLLKYSWKLVVVIVTFLHI